MKAPTSPWPLRVEEDGQVRTQPVFCLLKRELMESLVRFTHEGGRKIDKWTALHKQAIVRFDAAGDAPARLLQRQHAGRAAPPRAIEMKTLEQIAAQLQGYDPQALSAGRVGDFLAQLVEPVRETESVPVLDALGRVLANDLVSPISVPPHDNSAMDGFAFDGTALQDDAPLTLEVVGTALAGKAWQGHAGAGQCVKIMTGAIMPAGLDTVVPQEFTQRRGRRPHRRARRRAAARRQPPLQGRRPAEGPPALLQGERLGPAACGLVASLGLPSVECCAA